MADLFGLFRKPERRRSKKTMPREVVPCEQRLLLSGTYAADDGQYGTISHGYWTNIDVGANDPGGGTYREYSIIQQGEHGFGTINMLSGEFEYNSNAPFVGQDLIIYKVDVYEDGPEASRVLIGSDTATIYINATNAAPTAKNIDGGTVELEWYDTEVGGELTTVIEEQVLWYRVDDLLAQATDPDVFETLSIDEYGLSAGAELVVIDNVQWIKYTVADEGDTGFTYTIEDSFGEQSIGTVSLETHLRGGPWGILLDTYNIRTYDPDDDKVVNIKMQGSANTDFEVRIYKVGDPMPAWTSVTTDNQGKYTYTHGLTLVDEENYIVQLRVPGSSYFVSRGIRIKDTTP